MARPICTERAGGAGLIRRARFINHFFRPGHAFWRQTAQRQGDKSLGRARQARALWTRAERHGPFGKLGSALASGRLGLPSLLPCDMGTLRSTSLCPCTDGRGCRRGKHFTSVRQVPFVPRHRLVPAPGRVRGTRGVRTRDPSPQRAGLAATSPTCPTWDEDREGT